jgi:hypothetical protein
MEQELSLASSVLSIADLSSQSEGSNRRLLQSFAPLVGLLVSRRGEFV